VSVGLGRDVRTESRPGPGWHLPPPVEDHEIVNVASINIEEFGTHREGRSEEELRQEASMQTSDNNIVHVGFVVQYRVKDAFRSRYRVADPRAILRDAAQSAVRGIVGRHSIDGILQEERGVVQTASEEALQESLDRYESGLEVVSIELQEVFVPGPVKAAFDD